jgi:hypothetical protein
MTFKLAQDVVVGDTIITKRFHKMVNAIHCHDSIEDALIFEVCFENGMEAEQRYYTFEEVEIL